jgi:hypothetical protein
MRTEPDLEMQLECQHRIVYGDFFEPAHSRQLVLSWLELPYWMLLTGIATLAATYGSGVNEVTSYRPWFMAFETNS